VAKLNSTNCHACGGSILEQVLYGKNGKTWCASCYEWRFGTNPSELENKK